MKKTSKVLLLVITIMSIFMVMTISSSALASGDYVYEILENGTVSITDYTGSATELKIPSTIDGRKVTIIGRNAFCECENLQSVTIPNTVTTIDDSAFRDCESLYSFTFGKSVTSFGCTVFSGSFNLRELYYTSTIENWVKITFAGAISNPMYFAQSEYFNGELIADIVIPEGVNKINDYAFHNCNATSITIPSSVRTIGVNAFLYCYNLTSFSVSSNNKSYSSVNGVLFNKDKTTIICYPIGKTSTSYVIPNSVTSISYSAFGGCDSLQSITIPDSVTSIGDYAFNCCYRLQSVIISNGITTIGVEAFNNTLYYTEESNWQNGVLYIGNYLLEAKKDISGQYVIPSGTKLIADCAFANCENLTSVTIPDGVKTIGNYAFYYCDSLQSVTIGNGVKSIGNEAFRYCKNLQKVTIPNSVTSIGKGAFAECTGLKSVKISNNVKAINYGTFAWCESLTSITIPNGVTTIGEYAFYGCKKLTSVTAYPTVKTVEKGAFWDCTKITDVYYYGTKAQWEKMTLNMREADLKRVTIHYHYGEEHTSGTWKVTEKATLTKNGSKSQQCTCCDEIIKTTTIYSPKTFKLSTEKYTYNGKAKKPSVTVKDSKGNTLKKDVDYTVKYESGRKKPGKYTVTITFKGEYSGTKKLYFTIAPKAPTNVTTTQTTSSITLKWNKVTGADGYTVFKYNSKKKKYEKVKSIKGTSLKISNLKAGTAYKFKVKAYTKDGDAIWSAYSSPIETATKCKTPNITKLTTSNGKANIAWSNVSGESGYQIYYSTKKDSGFKKLGTYKANKVKTSKKLTKGKKYYIKVRAYKKTDSGTVYSAWSSVKSIKIK